MPGSIELAAVFDRAVGDRLRDAERLVLSLPQLFRGLLLHVDLGYRRASRFFVVVLHLSSKGYGSDARIRLQFWCARAGGLATSLAAMSARDRAAFEARLEQCDVKAREVAPQTLFDALDRVLVDAGASADRKRESYPRPTLAMDVGGPGWEGVTWDPSVHALFVPGTVAPPVGDEIALSLRIPGGERPVEVRARVGEVRVSGRPGAPAGYVLALQSPPEPLAAALARYQPNEVDRKRAAPRYPVNAPVKVSGTPMARIPLAKAAAPPQAAPARARIEYATEAELRSDYVSNLSQGGAFVRTAAPSPVGTQLTLEVKLPGGFELRAPSTVVFASSEGMGVKFELDAENEAILSSAMARISARPRRALVVDDDRVAREMLRDALAGRGFEVLTAEDAPAGLHVLAEELLTLDVLVTDETMPGMDGEAFVRTIRREGGESELAIAVVSGTLEPGMEKRLVAVGADTVLDKALGPERIARAADALVERKRASR